MITFTSQYQYFVIIWATGDLRALPSGCAPFMETSRGLLVRPASGRQHRLPGNRGLTIGEIEDLCKHSLFNNISLWVSLSNEN